MSYDWQAMFMNGLQETGSDKGGGPAIPRLAEGERRHVAALFLDLKDFTSLSESMDHEAVHSLVGGVMKVLSRVVDSHGGYVDKIEGDRIMALFGAKTAGENDSIRAVSCAVAMMRTIQGAGEYLDPRGISISARAGIASGTVTVAPDALGHLTAMGDTVNLASRLETMADEGMVLVSGRVHRECGDFFTWREMGERRVKGRRDAVQTWAPTGPGPVQLERWRTGFGAEKPPLSGRSRELEMLDSVFRAQEGCSTGANRLGGARHLLAVITGPGGIGKSRLVEEYLQWTDPRNRLVLRGYAGSFARPPFDIWISLLRNFAGIAPGTPEPGRILAEKLDAAAFSLTSRRAAETLRSAVEPLASLLSIEEDHEPGLEELSGAMDLNIVTALRDIIRALASENMVTVVLENFHNCDSASAEALSFLLGNCHQSIPLVVVVIGRNEPDWNFAGAAEDYCDTRIIEPSPLGDLECRGLIRGVTGGDLPDSAVDWLNRRSGGSPGYLIELLRYLADSGKLERTPRGWILEDPGEETVPDSLSGLISSRVDRMEPSLRKVLQYCSVLGEEFTGAHYKIYASMAGLGNTGVQQLEQLRSGGFLQARSEHGGAAYSFGNPLFRVTALDTLLYFNRKTLHRLAAESSIALLGENSYGASPEIACHYHSAGMITKAVEWGVKAMDLYASAYRHREVETWSQKLLEWVDGADRKWLFQVLKRLETSLAATGATGRREELLPRLMELAEEPCCSGEMAWVLREYGGYHYITGNTGKAASMYNRALTLAEKRGDLDLQSDILNRLGEIASTSGKVQRAEKYYARALETAETAGSQARAASALICMGTLHLNRGKAAAALEHYRRAEGLTDSRQMRMQITANIGMTLSILERGEEALERFQEALGESRETGDRIAEGAILGNMGILLQNRGSMDEALESFEAALAIARETGNRKGEGIVLGNMGILHNHQGRLIKARECYSRSLELRREAGNMRGQAVALLNMGSLDLELGSIRSARDCFLSALEIAREIMSPTDEAVALGNLGQVCLREGNLDEAEGHARDSVAISETTGARKNLASGLQTLGMILLEKGDAEASREVLDRSLRVSAEIGNRCMECVTLGILGWMDLGAGDHAAAVAKYQAARKTIEELGLGMKDMERFISLHRELVSRGAAGVPRELPGSWS